MRIKRLSLIFVVMISFISFNSNLVLAATSSEREDVLNNNPYRNTEEVSLLGSCGNNSSGLTSGGGSSSSFSAAKNVYVLGDSISTNGFAGQEIDSAIVSKNIILSKRNASSGRAITVDTSSNNSSGISAIEADSEIIKGSETIKGPDTIVIELGTNSGTEDLNTAIPEIIDKVKGLNPNIQVYWVNIFSEGRSRDKRNSTISALSTSLKSFKIIDASSANITTIDDKIHPDQAGQDALAKLIAESLSLEVSPLVNNVAIEPNTFNPLSLVNPNIPNEGQVIEALKNHITSKYPRSAFASNPQYVDAIFSTARTININPLLVIAIAQQENGYGTNAPSNTNNYFGMTKSGGGYLSFATPEEGIESFLNKVARNTTGQNSNYVNVTNFYEYIAVHQMGILAYPGEYPPESKGGDKSPRYLSYDPNMDVYISWELGLNANNSKGYTEDYNALIYYKNAINLVNSLTGLSLSNIPSRDGSSNVAVGCGSGLISGNIGSTEAKTYEEIMAGKAECDKIADRGQRIICTGRLASGVRYANKENTGTSWTSTWGLSAASDSQISSNLGQSPQKWLEQLKDNGKDSEYHLQECSGFVVLATYLAFGKGVGTCSASFLSKDSSGGLYEEVPISELKPGDLVIKSRVCGGSNGGHVGIFVSMNEDGSMNTLESAAESPANGSFSGEYIRKGGYFLYAARYVGD